MTPEVQTLTCDATGGTFQVTFQYSSSGNIAATATAVQVQAALQKMAT